MTTSAITCRSPSVTENVGETVRVSGSRSPVDAHGGVVVPAAVVGAQHALAGGRDLRRLVGLPAGEPGRELDLVFGNGGRPRDLHLPECYLRPFVDRHRQLERVVHAARRTHLHFRREQALGTVDRPDGLPQRLPVQPRFLLAPLDQRKEALLGHPRAPLEHHAMDGGLVPELHVDGHDLGGRVRGELGAGPHARLQVSGVEEEGAGLRLRLVLDGAAVLGRVPGALDRPPESGRRLEALEGEAGRRSPADLVFEGHRDRGLVAGRPGGRITAGDDSRLEVSLLAIASVRWSRSFSHFSWSNSFPGRSASPDKRAGASTPSTWHRDRPHLLVRARALAGGLPARATRARVLVTGGGPPRRTRRAGTRALPCGRRAAPRAPRRAATASRLTNQVLLPALVRLWEYVASTLFRSRFEKVRRDVGLAWELTAVGSKSRSVPLPRPARYGRCRSRTSGPSSRACLPTPC